MVLAQNGMLLTVLGAVEVVVGVILGLGASEDCVEVEAEVGVVPRVPLRDLGALEPMASSSSTTPRPLYSPFPVTAEQ